MGWFDDVATKIQGPMMNNMASPAGNTGVAGGTAGGYTPSVGDPAIPPPAVPPSGPVGHNDLYNGQTREQWRDAWQGQGQMTPQAADAWLQAHGAQQVNAKNGTYITPHGETLDLQIGRSGALDRGGMITAGWGGLGGPGGGGGGGPMPLGAGPGGGGFGGGFGGGGFGGGGGGYYGGGGGGGAAGSGWDGQKFVQPAAMGMPQDYTAERINVPGQLSADKFQAPTAAEMQNDPGLQFRLDQENKAFLQNRAAQHILRGGQGAKALTDYSQGVASQEYGNAYQRALQGYQANTGAQAQAYGLTNQYQQAAQGQNAANAMNANQQNFQNRFNTSNQNFQNALAGWQANTNAQLGQGNLNLGYTQAANTYGLGMANVGLGYHSADQQYNLGMTQAANSYSLGQGNLGLGWANYGLNQQGQDWQQNYGFPMTMGYNAAVQSGNWGGQYGNNAGGYYTNQGQAQGGGAYAGGNAWGNAIGGIANGVGAAVGGYRPGTTYGPAGRPPSPYGYG